MILQRQLSFSFFLLSCILVNVSFAKNTTSQWLKPNGSKPEFSDIFANGDSITLSWHGLNNSLNDLWLTAYDTKNNNFAVRIASNLNITTAGSFPWLVTVNTTEIDIDNRFVLRFIPTGSPYSINRQLQLDSPGFLLLQQPQDPSNDSTSTNATVSNDSEAAVSASSSSYSSTTASSTEITGPSLPLTIGSKVGIAIGVTIIVAVVLALVFWILRLRQRVKAASNRRSQGILPTSNRTTTNSSIISPLGGKRISGLHEVNGDRRQPIELSNTPEKKVVYHELAG